MQSSWWVADLFQRDPVLLGSWVFWVVFSITLHELGHGWAALRAGDETPRETGHMTWNPIVHMGPMSLLLFALKGICWGMMPVNPSRFRGFRGHADAFVAAAGPAMNVGLAIVCVALSGAWDAYATGSPMSDGAWRGGRTLLFTGAFLNLALLLLNLLPVPPLDGSRIVGSFVRPYARLAAQPSLALAAFLLVLFGAGPFIYPYARVAARTASDAIAGALPGGAPPLQVSRRVLASLTPAERAFIDRRLRESPEPAESGEAAPR